MGFIMQGHIKYSKWPKISGGVDQARVYNRIQRNVFKGQPTPRLL